MLFAFSLVLSADAMAAATVSDGSGTNPWSSSDTCPTTSGRKLCSVSNGAPNDLTCYTADVCSGNVKAWLVNNTTSGTDEDYVFYLECDSSEVYCCDIVDGGTQDLTTVGILGTSSTDRLFLEYDPPSGAHIQLFAVNAYSSVIGSLKGVGGLDYLLGSDHADTVDNLDGGDGNDDVHGQKGANTLTGGNGDDYCEGGLNADTLNGNAGDDLLVGRRSGDSAYGGDDDDFICGDEITSFTGPTDLHAFPTDDPSGYSGTCGNGITPGNDSLYGQSGVDTIYGSNGDDRIDGGADDDFLYGGDNNDEIYTGTGTDFADGQSDQDEICTENTSNEDEIYGQGGDDILVHAGGSSPNWVVSGGSGTDQCLPYPHAQTTSCASAATACPFTP
jgi:Ca2+-binding RTX toxin-like protein